MIWTEKYLQCLEEGFSLPCPEKTFDKIQEASLLHNYAASLKDNPKISSSKIHDFSNLSFNLIQLKQKEIV